MFIWGTTKVVNFTRKMREKKFARDIVVVVVIIIAETI